MTRKIRWTIYRTYGTMCNTIYQHWDEVYFDRDMTEDKVIENLKRTLPFNFTIRKGVV